MSQFGLIQVYTGDGKGKTTASLGLAFRACGQGLKVCMIQFMKDDPEYGEVKAAKYLPGFTLIAVGRNDFVNLSCPDRIDIELAQQGWERAKNIILSREFSIVILDEINVAMACGLLDVKSVTDFINQKSVPVEIVLTGRYAPPEILEIADLITEMNDVRHPFSKGINIRDGIDH